MNYSTMIENRKSVRAFRDDPVSADECAEILQYYDQKVKRLLPEVKTELLLLGTEAREALEGAAGYQDFLIGAPNYLVLLSAKHPHAEENAGFIMEDLVLKLTELGLDSCWINFTNADKVRKALKIESDVFEPVALVAFGYGKRVRKKIRLTIENMSKVDAVAQHHYFSPKKDVYELVSLQELGNHEGLDEIMGFYEDMLWNSFYAAAQSPSYLNRQPYAFVLRDHVLVLVQLSDPYTDPVGAGLDLGIVMLHFSAVASQWVGRLKWDMDSKIDMKLPKGCRVAAVCSL